MAYSSALLQADIAIGQWQTRVAGGRTVAKFADRVNSLLNSLKTDFSSKTAGSTTLRERYDRSKRLVIHVQTSAQNLFRQQLAILEASTINAFRDGLVQLTASSSLSDEPGAVDAELVDKQQQLLRKAIFDFRAKCASLEDDELGMSVASAADDLTDNLTSLLKEFPESAAYKLEVVRKLGRQTQKPKKKKGARAVNIGLNLVGMLRPPGYGNLQGFVGYATSLMGLPLDLLLGVQNDGEMPEVSVYCDCCLSCK